MKKRIVLVFALAALLFSLVSTVWAEEEAAGDFTYVLLPDGTAEITAYLGKEDVCVIPETVDGYTVTGLAGNIKLFRQEYNHVYDVVITVGPHVLEIPATVTYIGMLDEEALDAFLGAEGNVLTTWKGEWRVAEDNPVYRSIDGVLFDRTGRTLIQYPADREEENYAVPEGTEEIGCGAFCYNNSLKGLTLPETLKRIGDYAFAGCAEMADLTIPQRVDFIGWLAFPCVTGNRGSVQLRQILVSPYNSVYYDVDGVLFSRADRKLICYPAGRQETSYDVPEGTQILGPYAFNRNQALNILCIPEGVTVIEEMALGAMPNRDGLRIMLPESLTQIDIHQFYKDYAGRYKFVVYPGGGAEAYCLEHHWLFEYADE